MRSPFGTGTPLALWAPALLYAAAIFFASSIESPPKPLGGLTDKHEHVIAYAGLAVLIVRALARAVWVGVSARVCLLAAVLTTAYGVSDEWHQRFVPGRFAEWNDLLADATGAVVGVMLAWALARVFLRTRVGATK